MLLAARDEDSGAGMTDLQLRDEVLTMLLAGHETTSLALSWTYYLLSQHPEVEHGIVDEVDRVIGDERPSFAHLDRLTCTRQAIQEALRLYPPAWGFSRQALGDDEIGGYRVPKGALVFLIPFVIHRRPQLWPDPERFDPDRFTPEQESERPRFAYIPFGGGPRGCIGNQFAMVEAQLIVADDRAAVSPRARARSGHPAGAADHTAAVTGHPRVPQKARLVPRSTAAISTLGDERPRCWSANLDARQVDRRLAFV